MLAISGGLSTSQSGCNWGTSTTTLCQWATQAEARVSNELKG
jgi:hypothetical protein